MIYFRTIFYIIFVIFNININAQCSMCRAVAESSQSGGSSIADGLNTGILYLMMFPYLLLIYALIRLYFREKQQT
ncbi:MAG: hypothetical protein CBD51_004905 [Flavobacteriales bacterium TMED191]|nr:MAG: hypothetical protein CBD51_004905 [Flavobacteriales bacterium TMED191]